MEKIAFKFGPYLGFDHTGKQRWFGILPDSHKTSQARLVMMNFLHCDNIPKLFHIHHINGDTTDDRIENLQLMRGVAHNQLHMPRDYKYGASSTEDFTLYQRLRRNHPDFRNAYLAKRKEVYHAKLKQDPVYIQKNRDRARMYYIENKEKINAKQRVRRGAER